jgi:diadenosine tetraphosphatase ApaH/serine/threonine PP2A family protein phosphatase
VPVRLGIFGDIHGNLEALTAVHAEVAARVDQLVCTGDVVGYGGSPRECIGFLAERNIPCVRGNHDHYTAQKDCTWNIQPYALEAIRWTQGILAPDERTWLERLPAMLEIAGVTVVHASLQAQDFRSWPYILNPQIAMFHFYMQTTRFCFYGHTHLPLQFTIDRGQISFEFLSSRIFPANDTCKYLLNPGSVGQPRDFDHRASALIFDTDTLALELLRVEYDIATAQAKILAAGLPKMLAERLSKGR